MRLRPVVVSLSPALAVSVVALPGAQAKGKRGRAVRAAVVRAPAAAAPLAAPDAPANPLTNAEFTATIRRVCHAPFGLPAPRWLLEVGAFLLRTETELLIKSRRVAPGTLLAEGFVFRHPHLLPAIEQLVA